MPARRSYRAASAPVATGLLLGLASLVLGGAACTDGTTPDCSDAQCLVVVEVSEVGVGEAGDAADDARDDSSADDGAIQSDGGRLDGALE